MISNDCMMIRSGSRAGPLKRGSPECRLTGVILIIGSVCSPSGMWRYFWEWGYSLQKTKTQERSSWNVYEYTFISSQPLWLESIFVRCWKRLILWGIIYSWLLVSSLVGDHAQGKRKRILLLELGKLTKTFHLLHTYFEITVIFWFDIRMEKCHIKFTLLTRVFKSSFWSFD